MLLKSTVAMLSATVLLFAACGGGSDEAVKPSGQGTPAQTDASILEAEDQPNEGGLRDVALEGGHALISGDATKMYSLYHKSFQEKCPFNKFVGVVALLRGFYGESFQKSEPRVEDIRIEGNKGYATINYYLDGRFVRSSVEEGDDPESDTWLWEDGKWWAGAFISDPTPCELDADATKTPR